MDENVPLVLEYFHFWPMRKVGSKDPSGKKLFEELQGAKFPKENLTTAAAP